MQQSGFSEQEEAAQAVRHQAFASLNSNVRSSISATNNEDAGKELRGLQLNH